MQVQIDLLVLQPHGAQIIALVMWNPCYRALLNHGLSGCRLIKMWRRRPSDVVNVRTLDQSSETITSNLNGTGCDMMR
jgi:hypothetical protein